MRLRFFSAISVLFAVFLFLPRGPLGAASASSTPVTIRPLPSSEARGGSTQLYATDHLLVKFRKGVTAQAQTQTIQAAGGERIRSSRSGYEIVRVPAGKTVDQMLDLYAARADVERVQRDAIVSATFTPNDPQFPLQWNFDANHLNLPSAWDQDTTSPKYGGDPSIVVAVIDTGIAYEDYGPYKKAPDFAQTAFTAGYDFVNGDTHPNDDHFHGTHVAMTIAESTNNGIAMAGIAYRTTIMPIKVLNSLGAGNSIDVADGILFAIANGADVINMSLGTYVNDPVLESAISDAVDAGIVVVAAVGNGDAPVELGGDGIYGTGDPVVLYPAKYPGVIAVGAVRYDRASAPYSNYGTGVQLVAPGGDTSVDQNGDGYGDGILQQTIGSDVSTFAAVFLQGTSMASPHVAGAAALLLADGVDSGDVLARLQSTAQKNLPNYSRKYHGAGMIDAAAMMLAPPKSIPPPTVSHASAVGGDKKVVLKWKNPSISNLVKVRIYRQAGTPPKSFGSGTVVFDDAGQTFTDTSVTNGKLYYYNIYVLNAFGSVSAPITVSSIPGAPNTSVSPLPLVQGFSAKVVSSTSVALTWKAPTSNSIAGVLIRRSAVGLPSLPTTGVQVFRGTGTSLTDTSLLTGTTYVYAAFTYDRSGTYSAPVYVVRTPGSTDMERPTPVRNVKVGAFPGRVRLAWEDGFDFDDVFTMVVRKRGTTAPSNPKDGLLVYTGADQKATDRYGLVPGALYTYAFYVVDQTGNVSPAVSARTTLPGPLVLSAPLSSGGPQVRLFKPNGTWNGTQFFAYDSLFRGGVRVAAGDVDGDGKDEIVVGAGKGGGPQIRVFNSDGTPKPIQFFAFAPSFRGGIDVAVGDTDGDGKAEIAACQFSGGQAWVKIYKYNAAHTIVGTWNAFGDPEVGCTVAMGDVDKDGKDEVIVGAGKGGGPHVRVFEANGEPKPIQFFAFLPSFRGGIDVAAGDVNGDGRDEVVVSQLSGGQGWVKTYGFTADRPVLGTFNAFGAPEVGASVDAIDLNGDGKAEILAAAGVGGGPHVRAFYPNGTSFNAVSFFAFDPAFRGGVNVSAGYF